MRIITAGEYDPAEPRFYERPSGLLVWSEKPRRPTCLDLFSGCGGFSLGMIQAGFDVVAGADHDAACAHSYLVNLGSYPVQFWWVEPEDEARMEKFLQCEFRGKKGELAEASVSGCARRGNLDHDFAGVRNFFFGDVSKLTGATVLASLGMARGELDCVCGGPPCQGFSTAGRQEVEDPRNSLVFHFARLVCELQPKTFVMENVPGMLNMVTPEGLPVIDALCRVFADGGMGTYEALRKSLAGAPTRRGAVRGSKDRPRPQRPRRKQKAGAVQQGLFDQERRDG